MQSACQKTYIQGLSSDFEQFFLVKNNFVYLLTSVQNNADDADATDNADTTDDANDYNRVIGIALLKAFSCVIISSFKSTTSL